MPAPNRRHMPLRSLRLAPPHRPANGRGYPGSEPTPLFWADRQIASARMELYQLMGYATESYRIRSHRLSRKAECHCESDRSHKRNLRSKVKVLIRVGNLWSRASVRPTPREMVYG